MKHLFFIIAVLTLSFGAMAQGKGKAKGKFKKHNTEQTTTTPGTVAQKGNAKNQPKKVQAALLRDYPNARNVVWSKYKGDYTATFNNGIWRSTAVYHANGERRDTRTPLTRTQLPGSIWDQIFKRDNIQPTSYIQIERPSVAEKIIRVLAGNNTAYYYNESGNKVQYDY